MVHCKISILMCKITIFMLKNKIYLYFLTKCQKNCAAECDINITEPMIAVNARSLTNK